MIKINNMKNLGKLLLLVYVFVLHDWVSQGTRVYAVNRKDEAFDLEYEPDPLILERLEKLLQEIKKADVTKLLQKAIDRKLQETTKVLLNLVDYKGKRPKLNEEYKPGNAAESKNTWRLASKFQKITEAASSPSSSSSESGFNQPIVIGGPNDLTDYQFITVDTLEAEFKEDAIYIEVNEKGNGLTDYFIIVAFANNSKDKPGNSFEENIPCRSIFVALHISEDVKAERKTTHFTGKLTATHRYVVQKTYVGEAFIMPCKNFFYDQKGKLSAYENSLDKQWDTQLACWSKFYKDKFDFEDIAVSKSPETPPSYGVASASGKEELLVSAGSLAASSSSSSPSASGKEELSVSAGSLAASSTSSDSGKEKPNKYRINVEFFMMEARKAVRSLLAGINAMKSLTEKDLTSFDLKYQSVQAALKEKIKVGGLKLPSL